MQLNTFTHTIENNKSELLLDLDAFMSFFSFGLDHIEANLSCGKGRKDLREGGRKKGRGGEGKTERGGEGKTGREGGREKGRGGGRREGRDWGRRGVRKEGRERGRRGGEGEKSEGRQSKDGTRVDVETICGNDERGGGGTRRVRRNRATSVDRSMRHGPPLVSSS